MNETNYSWVSIDFGLYIVSHHCQSSLLSNTIFCWLKAPFPWPQLQTCGDSHLLFETPLLDRISLLLVDSFFIGKDSDYLLV